MRKNRLIDEVQSIIIDKNLSYELTHLCITQKGFNQLVADFKEEFRTEYFDLGREASVNDVEEYINLPIVVEEVSNGEEFYVLTKV